MAKKTKDQCAVSMGKRGGKKGGPARAKALSSTRREAIASQGGKAKAAKHGGKKSTRKKA